VPGPAFARREGHLTGDALVSTTGQDDYSGGQVPGRRLHAHSNRDGLRGSRNVRNEFASVLDFIRPGDVLVVVKLDRLGRNMRTFSTSCTNLKKKEQAGGWSLPSIPAARWAAWS
jgi:DNA invertase Pin-like site-specific DNA recombinase